ncbi:hypothetical protein [Brevibacillus choshinensis]|uniref:hypothetical protein n=1 Tax=Brevibacillus choshinensis TaxID=54911 RepID=UPI002E230AD3|nr:hypothetical protein [Brevibacillus choshinensis]
MKSAKHLKTVLALCLTFLLAPHAVQAEQQQSTTISNDVPTEREIQVPPGLTEPFFVPFMRSSQDWDDYRKPFPSFALVSPAGKVIGTQEYTFWPGYISPLKNGYGFFKTGNMFKFSEYIIYDKQGNIQKTAAYDHSFTQMDGEWFLYQPEAGLSYFYNARTKATKLLTGDEKWWSIPDQYTGKVAYDIHHYPFVKNHVVNGALISYKMGLKDMNGNVTCQPFFDEYMGYSEGLHRVKINGMTHFITHEGKVVLKPSRNYKVESNFHSGVFIVSGKKDQDEFYLLMDKKGAFVSKKYAFIRETSDGQFLAVSKTKDGYFFQKINAMDKATTSLPYKLDRPEELKQLSQTGKLFHTDTHIVTDIANKQPFPFPHKLLTPPRNETVVMEYTLAGMKRMGAFSHEGRQIYSRPVK